MAQTVGGYPDPTGRDLVDCHAVKVTLPGLGVVDFTLNVKTFQVTKELTSDLPDGSRLQVGYPSASATFTLEGAYAAGTGEKQDMGWLFGRYSTDSPLWHASAVHAPVTIDAGLSGVLVRQFTGLVDTYTVKPDGTVDVSCLDRRSLLRSVASLPPVVTLPPYNAGLTSEFAIDALLRAGRPTQDISTWPSRRANCVLAVGFRTSLWPEVGTLGSVDPVYQQPTDVVYGPGAFGSALYAVPGSGLGDIRYIADGTVSSAATFLEFWMTPQIDFAASIVSLKNDSGSEYMNLAITAGTGNLITFDSPASHWSWSPAGGIAVGVPHHVGVSVVAGVVTLYLDGDTYTAGPTMETVTGLLAVSVALGGNGFEAFQVTAETVPTFGPFTPTAVLDPSLNTLQVVPDMSGDPWQILQLIADAELGVCGFDEWGIFRFRNRRTIQAQPLTRTVTSTDSLVDLNVQTSAASVANRCQVDATPWSFGTVARIWQLDTVTKVPAGGTVTLTPTLDMLAVETDATVGVLPDGWLGTAHSYYRASSDQYGNSEHPGLTFTVTQPSSSQLNIVIHNPTAGDAWLVSPANYTDVAVGTPLLYIAGIPVVPASTQTQDFQWPPLIPGVGGAPATGGAASTDVGEIAVQLTGNAWIQDADAGLMLATDVVLDQHLARDTFDSVSIVPDHELQLTDRKRIVDSSATGVDDYVYVFASTLSYDGGSQSQTVTVRTIGVPGAWLIGVPGRSEIGVTTYVYA